MKKLSNQLKKTKRFLGSAAIAFMSALFFVLSLQASPQGLAEATDSQPSARSTSYYRDFFDSSIYKPVVDWIRLDKWFSKATFHKSRALDVNAFDEVPDSTFFVNRHGKTRLSREALIKGPATGSGPDPAGPWTVTKGKIEGVTAGLFIEDQKGVKYLLKFDPKDHPDMATAAEVIAHKFFHAIGYYVPEYYLVTFSPSILKPGDGAMFYDTDGFKKPLTSEAIWDIIGKVPQLKGGVIRASASQLLTGDILGYMDFDGRRRQDPDDLIAHEKRRSIRALRIFGAWLNHYDLRKSNTLDVVETRNGKRQVIHYLIDFGDTFGSSGDRAKVPAAGFEHVIGWKEMAKSIVTLKINEKPWEKRWDAANRSIAYPSLGYFDNERFDPGRWTAQLQYDVFDQVTASDAFWASKIIMAFTDDDIREIVKTGMYTNASDAKTLSEILIARRNQIADYWFGEISPLDQFRLFHMQGSAYQLQFKDLAVHHGLSNDVPEYRFNVSTDGESSGWQETQQPVVSFDAHRNAQVTVKVQVKRTSTSSWSQPPVTLSLNAGSQAKLQLVEIDHGV